MNVKKYLQLCFALCMKKRHDIHNFSAFQSHYSRHVMVQSYHGKYHMQQQMSILCVTTTTPLYSETCETSIKLSTKHLITRFTTYKLPNVRYSFNVTLL